MKKIVKLLILAIALTLSVNSGFAISTSKIDKMVKTSGLDETATIAISIKNAGNGNTVYEHNSKKLLHPASTLKVFTTYAALESLGSDYLFKTQFYKDKENNLFIKLGADPLLTSFELKQALQKIKESGQTNFQNLYIDDSIIDKKEFAPGWMWDDDISPYTPKVSAYNLDGNVINVNMNKMENSNIEFQAKTSYPTTIFSYVKTDDKTDYLDINRYNWNHPEVIEIYGNVSNIKPISIPISSMRRYFIYQLKKDIEDLRYTIEGTSYASKLLPNDAELLTEISHPITATIPAILQNSNNLMSESVFKIAAAQKYSSTGTSALGSCLFNEFYNSKGINTDNIIIKDGSGVSRNNLLSVDWATTALDKLYKQKGFETYKEQMAQPGEGTLSNRLFDLRGDAWLKTGSLSNISAVTGYVHSLDGNTYSVAIFTQNFTKNQNEIKALEDEIIKLIYSK